MAKSFDYDVIVIGAGIAGFVSAVTANGLGKRVAIVEKRVVGGNCTNYTCIPSKTLIRVSHLSRDIAHLERFGLEMSDPSGLDTRKVMVHIRSVVQKAYEKDLPETFEKIGITVLSGVARFQDRHHVQVNGRTLSAKKFIIATGTRPLIPPIAGLRDIDYLTSENLYELDELPKSLITLGGGVDGLEYASAFGRLGVDTTVVEMAERLLPTADREVAKHLLGALRADGIKVLTGTKAMSVQEAQGKVLVGFAQEQDGREGEIEADRLLAAIGRLPDLEELSLESAGVKYTPKGIVTDRSLRTSAPNIFACGDIVGPYQLASTAEYQGTIAATNALLPAKRKVDYRNNVYVIFTDPQLAYLGLTEEQAHAKYGHTLKVYRFDYANMRRALVDGAQVGMAKFLCDGRGRLVGAHILGESAAEVIHEVQVIKAFRKPLHKLYSVTHAYPTYAQALVGRASQLAFLDKLGNSFMVNAALRIFPGLSNRMYLARDRLAEVERDVSDVETTKLRVSVETEATDQKAFVMEAVCMYDGACVIELPEDLTNHDEEPFLAVYSGSRSTDNKHMILNFSQVRRMNGIGAAMLVKLCIRAAKKGLHPAAFGLSEGLGDVFRVTGLDQVIRIHKSEEDALAAAGVVGGTSTPESETHVSVFEDREHWAEPVETLTVPPMPEEARNLNVDGCRAVGPVNGFGQLWQKIYRLHIDDHSTTPENAVATLKQNFVDFQPAFNRFFASQAGIRPGEIVLIDSITPGGPVSTGVMVLYADERSFTFMTPQGHPECGFVSFSAYGADGKTIVQILGLTRASDPLFEGAFHLVGSKIQVRIWTHVLTSMATFLGVPADITVEQTCVDRRLRWSEFWNVKYNSQIRTLAAEPKRWVNKLGSGRSGKGTHGD
jgi:anti-anti-sigma factor